MTSVNGKRCLRYNENGLKHRKIEPKVVTHYDNSDNSTRCFVNLHEFYVNHCPPFDEKKKIRPFYLTALKKLKGNIWYSNVSVGHNTLATTTNRICGAAGISGYKTNHSLRVTAATRLFQAGIDEQMTMKQTGHRSIEGVRVQVSVTLDILSETIIID